jgi:hypothetical protein
LGGGVETGRQAKAREGRGKGRQWRNEKKRGRREKRGVTREPLLLMEDNLCLAGETQGRQRETSEAGTVLQ